MSGLQKPPKSLLRKVGRAIADFDMIRDGDRILLGVSGGKDSLTLLHILLHLKSYAPVKF
ncbi:MAG: tRNA 2-thiocytidine biosynthesis protein TtcA, partial [Candidatus Sedimenticola sp. (ex Thyasira tokunagai)]